MRAAAGRPALLRYPFLWAFLAGVIVLTLIRPCLRRIPEPPPVTGRFPEAILTDQEGRPFGRDDMRGAVWVAAMLRAGCGEPCDAAARRLGELEATYAALRVDGIRFLGVVETPAPRGEGETEAASAGPPRRVAATGKPGALRDLAEALCGAAEPEPPGCLAIIDAEGNLRGRYAADADGFNEVYNRARHVRDAGPPEQAAR